MAAAKKPAAKPAAKDAKGGAAPKKKGNIGTILIFLLVGGALPFFLPTCIILMGMLPSLIALITDTDPQRSKSTTISAMNFAGVFPFIIEVWQKGHTLGAAWHIMGQTSTWLIMFGAAGVGHLIHYAIPPAMGMIAISRTEARLQQLKEGLGKLKEVWGPDIATTKSIDDMRRATNPMER